MPQTPLENGHTELRRDSMPIVRVTCLGRVPIYLRDIVVDGRYTLVNPDGSAARERGHSM